MKTSSNFKISSALPYVLVAVLSSFLCFAFCKFETNQVIENNIEITKSISTSVIIAEHYIEKNLKCATTALHMYLKHNPMPKKKEDLWQLRDDAGVAAFTIGNNRGRTIYTTTSNLDTKEGIEMHRKSGGWFRDYPELEQMTANNQFIKYTPLRNSFAAGLNLTWQEKAATSWSKQSQLFANAFVDIDDLALIFKDNIAIYGSVQSISLSSPSGLLILNSDDMTPNRNKIKQIDEYTQNPSIFQNFNKMTISLPFGGIIGSEGVLHGGKNEAGQYFYVMNVTFDKSALNTRLSLTIAGFVVSTLFLCVAIYYTKAYVAKSSELVELSERMGDKVTHLCNTRLGEVRRYVTKIVKDSMRVDNMNKELPEEMVQLLDRAFREVDEKGLISEKKEDVQ